MAWEGESYAFAIKIEGLGDQSAATATDKRYRFATGVIDGDADDLYSVDMLSFPSQIGSSVDLRRGEVASSAMTFRLSLSDLVLASFFGAEPAVVARLTASLSASGTTINLSVNTLASTTIYLGREAIHLGPSAVAAGAGYNYASSVRGILGTQALAHPIGDTEDTEVFSALPRSSLAGRAVELVRVFLGGDYSEEETRWMGRLRAQSWSPTREGGAVELAADSVLESVKGTKIYRSPWRGRVSSVGLLVGARPLDPAFSRLDIAQETLFQAEPTNAAAPLVFIEDAGAFRLRSTAPDLPTGGVIATRYVFDDFSPFAGSPPIEEAPKTGARVREIFSSHPDAPSTGRLSQEAGKLALQLLLTTDAGGNHAVYDLALPPLAGGVPAFLVDVDAFLDFNERVKHVPLARFHIGHDSNEPIDLFELIQRRILAPFAASLAQGSGGKLTVVWLRDAVPYGSNNTLAQSQIVRGTLPELVDPLFDGVDRIEVRYADRPVIGPSLLSAVDVRKYQRQPFGEHDTLEIDARAVESAPLATELAQRLIQRFHLPIPILHLTTLRTADFWIGDTVAVTCDHVPLGGERGLDEAVGLVVAREESVSAQGHTLRLSLLLVGAAIPRAALIAPSAVVASHTGSGPAYTLTVTANAYTDPDLGPLGSDAAGFASGDVAQLCDQYGAVRDASVNIGTVSGNTIAITNCSVTPAAGDVLRVAAYTSAATSQQSRWAFIADSGDALGSDGAKQYTTG